MVSTLSDGAIVYAMLIFSVGLGQASAGQQRK